MTREIGVGLISVGWMGRLHTAAYRALPIIYPELGVRPRLVQAADSAPDRAEFATETLGYASASTDYRDVLANPDVDVVSICSPNFMHAEMAIAAAAAGKSFWIEKPAGRSAEETALIAAAAESAGVATAVGFNYRNAPAVEHLRELIADGALGRITNVRGSFFADYSADPRGALSWRFINELAGSGVSGDLLGHLVDLMHYLLGPVEEVTAIDKVVHAQRAILPMGSGTHFDIVEDGEMGPVENEDYMGALVRFADTGQGAGVVGTLEASRVAVGPRASYGIEIYGTGGSARWNFERLNELELALSSAGNHVGYTTIHAGPSFGDFAHFQPGAGTGTGYDDLKVVEAKKFLAAYVGKDRLNANIQDALSANQVVSATVQSAADRRWIQVPAVAGTTAALR